MIRVALLTEHPLLAKGLATTLAGVPEFDLMSACYDRVHLLELLAAREPDLLLIDFQGDVDFDFLLELRQRVVRSRLVLWVAGIAPELAYQTMRLGVRGILQKSFTAEVMVRCLQQIAAGQCWFEETLTWSFLNAKTITLTMRESQLVSLVSQGLKNKEIASVLGISENSVKIYLSRLFRKVGARDRYGLALYGLKNMASGQAGPGHHPGLTLFGAAVPAVAHGANVPRPNSCGRLKSTPVNTGYSPTANRS